MIFERMNRTKAILTGLLLICLLYVPSCVIAEPSPVRRSESVGDPNKTSVSRSRVTEQICTDILKGDFTGAQKLLIEVNEPGNPSIEELGKVVGGYETIEQRRQAAKKAAYEEQFAELAKIEKQKKEHDDVNTHGDVNDVNDVNDLVKVLSVISKASEFADEGQKKELLEDAFVKQTFQRAIDKASSFEAKGKWIDAYLMCYSWLSAIDKDNKSYSDYAERLVDKAEIVASFEDSPCETSKERYTGIRGDMFIRAINVLNFSYVGIVDYAAMADKSLERCKLLGEVMTIDASLVRKAGYEIQSDKNGQWLSGLDVIREEVRQSLTGISKDKFISVFEKTLKLNTSTMMLPEKVLIAQFSEAALSSLDPYTVMVWPRQVQDFDKMMTNEFTGIGIEINKDKGQLTVASLLPDTPAYNSSLDASDIIEKVDGIPTKDMSLNCAVKNITGPAGTKVKLTIRHHGEDKSRDITLTRAKITVQTIRGWQRTQAGKWLYMVDPNEKIGYVRITSFSEKTASDFEDALKQLETEGMKGLILDLRFDSGGFLNTAIEIVDKFIDKGLIVSTRPRPVLGMPTYAYATREGTARDYPLVILINSYSASASEIVAGALQDPEHKRAVLVGERTYGKGSVQTITNYPQDGAKLKYTMAYYHLPSGQKVESQDAMKKLGRSDWGVGPDVEVKLRSDELKKMLEVQKDNDVLFRVGHNNGSDAAESRKHTIKETLGADPQLAIAILVAKTKILPICSN